MTTDEIKNLLARFAIAWSQKDAAEIASLFCEHGEYRSSVETYPGASAKGREEIGSLVKEMLALDQNSIASTTSLLIDGQAAAWRWRYDFPDGSIERGSDFFEFRGGLISLKDAYRKVVTTAVETRDGSAPVTSRSKSH